MTEFTPDRYELRHGRFIIVPTGSGDKYGEVDADFTEESDYFMDKARRVRDSRLEYGYDPYIFEGYIVVDGHNDGHCMDALFHVTTRDAAEARLAEMKLELATS